MATHLYHVVFWSMLMNLVVIYSDIIAKHFTEQPLYTDVFLKVNISKEYTADSFFACALLCGPTCSCVGYLEASKRCRVFDSCNTTDTVNEDGWIYYTTPSECDGDWMLYNGHCYLLNRTKLSWPDAKSECTRCGAYLVEIKNEDENKWIEEYLLQDVFCRSKYDCTSWIGGTDIETEGQFVWGHSKTPFTYTNWDFINPNDFQ
ncbi:C-type mannose receptor 2 [Magallana gigas]|uniref:C-type mannose receptor 2 n=1 Tax=Magallana gigas TaxID=29159 RepID=UPI00333F494E